MSDIKDTETTQTQPTHEQIKECVRQTVCKFLRDALEWNDFQIQLGQSPEVVAAAEVEIMEDFQLVIDYLKLTNYNRSKE